MLPENRRKQLDAIVLKMGRQNAPKADVQAVVNDFKRKFDTPEKKGFIESAASELKEDAASLGKGVLGLGKSAINVPLGAGKFIGASFAGEKGKALREQSAKQALAPLRGAAKLIKNAAVDVPRELGTGFGKFQAGTLLNKPEVAREGAAQALGGISQAAGFVPSLPGQILAGVTGSASESLNKLDEGESIGGKEALARATVSGAGRGLLFGSLKKLLTKESVKKGAPEQIRTKLALEERQINAAARQGKINPQQGKKLIEVAKKARIDDEAIKPLELTGKRFNKFTSDLNRINQQAGKRIGVQSQKLGAEKGVVNAKPILNQFKKDLNNKNVKIRDGKLDFSNSDLKGLSSAGKNTLQEQFDLFRKKGVTPRSLLSNNRDLGNRLFSGSKDAKFTGAEGILNKVRSTSVKSLNKQFPKLAKDNAIFSETSDLLDKINRMAGQEGVKSSSVLRRLFGNARGQSSELIKQSEKLAKKFGIDSGKNIFKEANFSVVAEEAAGVLPPTGFQGQISRAVPTSKAQILGKAVQKAEGAIVGSPEQALIRILENPETVVSPSIISRISSSLSKNEILNIIAKIGR